MDLPTPEQYPDRDLVIFDGQCSFCRGQVERLHRWDWRKRLAFVSLHAPLVAERFPELEHDQLMEEMYLVDGRGRYHGGAAALRVISRRLPLLWLAAPFLHIPGTLTLWQWGYRQVASRRYRLSGGPVCEEGTCHLHRDRAG